MSECESSFCNAGNAGENKLSPAGYDQANAEVSNGAKKRPSWAKFTTFYKLRTNRLIPTIHVPSRIHPLTIAQNKNFGYATRMCGAFAAHIEFVRIDRVDHRRHA